MNISDPRFIWKPKTDVMERFKAAGFTPPEKAAEAAEADARREGAVRCLQVIEAEMKQKFRRVK